MSPFFALLGLPPREARFDVRIKGKPAGVATYRLSDRPGGGRVTRLRIALADGSTSESLSLSDAMGQAVRSEDVVRRGKSYSKTTVSYSAPGDATIVEEGRKPLVVRFDRGGSRKDPSETWFRTVKPEAGTWAVFRKLDPRKRAWTAVRVTYVGRRGGGNLVRQLADGKTTSFSVDDGGLPIAIEAGDLRMVRR